jgi:hypothetical protein
MLLKFDTEHNVKAEFLNYFSEEFFYYCRHNINFQLNN